MTKNNPTILIAGGAGFIGSHLSAFALRKGYRVLVVDNFITGRRSNIEKLNSHQQFSLLEADITTEDFLTQIVSLGTQFSHVFHLASPASPPKYQQYPVATLQANSIGTQALLEIARKQQARFVFASTSEVYGDPLEHPQKESYWGNVNSFGERACYDEAKRFGEAMCYSYHKKFDVSVRLARIFNTYGPNMDPEDGRVVSNFINQAIRNEAITIYGDGKQTRSLCYVSDLVKGLWRLGTTAESGIVVNLGNPRELSIKEIAQKIISLTNSQSEIVHQGLPSDDPQRRQPDISRARELLNWEPEVSLDDGLLRTIKYFQQLKD